MKHCIFCQVELNKTNRAVEHVLSRSFLDRINFKKEIINGWSYTADDQEITPNPVRPAGTMICGDVCKICNNGWMNDLDLSVQDTLVDIFNGNINPYSFDDDLIFNLSRFLLKTAFTYIGAGNSTRRHFPELVLKEIHNPEYLPNGFLSFFAKGKTVNKAQPTVFLMSLDIWLSAEESIERLKSKNVKFGIQLNDTIIGCCYFDCDNPTFGMVDHFHIPMLVKNSHFIQNSNLQLPEPPENFTRSFLFDTLYEITFF